MDRRKPIIRAFQATCQGDDRVLAAFIGGSFATDSTDEFSDLDLYAIIAGETYDEFLAEHREFFESYSDPLFLEHFDGFGFDMYVFILADGIQGELALGKPDHFLHIHGGPYEVLVDKEGLLEDVEFPLQKPTSSEQLDQLREQIIWFWRDMSLFSVAIGRGQLWTAVGYLQSMRLRCIKLLRLDHTFEAWSDGYEKVESAVESQELRRLEATFPRLDHQEMLEAVDNLVSFYGQLARRLAMRHGVEYPQAIEAVVIDGLARSTGHEISLRETGSG